MTVNNYWHMQMHPTDELEKFSGYIDWILEHRGFIGMGEWEGGRETINTFVNEMTVNDIVAIKRGSKLVALVQIIGGAYLIYLGYKGIRAKAKGEITEIRTAQAAPQSAKTALVKGFLCNVLNPKAPVYFVSIFTIYQRHS